MAVFKEEAARGYGRCAEDRRRHKELVEESIKKNIGNIIAEESIIGQRKDKKIKIPIQGIKEYQFIFGKNKKEIASGDGSEKRGDRIGTEKQEKNGKQAGQAGNEEGEDIYETEITIEELIKYLFDDLKLPDIDQKKLSDNEAQIGYKTLGYQLKGIPPRLAKKKSVIEKIKRKQGYLRNQRDHESYEINNSDEYKELQVDSDKNLQDRQGFIKSGILSRERVPFMEEDLRYRRIKEKHKRDFNAVVICIMDVSGSMDQTKKYIARSFYFLLYQFIRLKYSSVEVVFIAHTTTAKEVNETEFFHRGESGGTYISSGYEKALEIIEQRYNPLNWNVYAFHCSDGDNWTEDNKRAVEFAEQLCKKCNLFGYGEIIPGYFSSGSTIKTEFQRQIKSRNFVIVTMTKKEDVLPGLKKLLEKEA